MNKRLKFFVAYHKGPIYVENENIIPMHLGKALSDKDLGIIGDNTGDNISDKNHEYAEITAQYRVRKNYDLEKVDYVGFCHYRRYFTYKYKPSFFKSLKIIYRGKKSWLEFFIRIVMHITGAYYTDSLKNIDIIKDNYNIILKHIENINSNIFLSKKSYTISLKQLGLRNNKIWDVFYNSLLDQYPEYKDTLSKLNYEHRWHICNMFIMDSKTFKDYAEWLFNVLFAFDKKIKELNLYDDLLKERIVETGFRPYGYLGEFMLNLYIIHNENLKISRDLNITFFG